ncbi:hypothetical protein HYH03_012223 [Edaphochlamys debaryana]|uniref:Uncharacterized protein n=1 Tax=Edaphochlamys debaryana TaxID=47281 RepID=A0A835XS34_9CHLO|nr:hypothetical protein HYH03_012223 [Edaphochlamys debaryana]|eukprot:KAG2489198.1 hypothetical protein HYH03_012223 [Edaphochlamys debaryana]
MEGAARAFNELASVWAPPGLVSQALAGELEAMAAWRPQLEVLEEMGQPSSALRRQVAEAQASEGPQAGELRRVVEEALEDAVFRDSAQPRNKDVEALEEEVSELWKASSGIDMEVEYLQLVLRALSEQPSFEGNWSALSELTFTRQGGFASIYRATYMGT